MWKIHEVVHIETIFFGLPNLLLHEEREDSAMRS